jgi:chromosome segregation ATPase
MNIQEINQTEVRLKVENIGGIEQSEVSFSPGVTVLTGRNATNRTSLLRAIMAGLGSDRVSLKSDADSGSVTFQFGDKSYTRSLQRQNNTTKISGDSYLDDSELADLFAFLLESNEARRAVALEQDLRNIIMQPVDADAINAEIRQLKSERDNVDDRIEKRRRLEEKLPELEQRRRHLVQEIENKTEEVESKRKKLDDLSANAEEARSEQSELDQKMQTLQQKRSSLDTTEFRLDSERESLASIKQEREEIKAEYDDLTNQEMGDLDYIESEINRLRDNEKRLERELNKLQNVIQFNKEMLEGTSTDIATALRGDDIDNGSVTDKILEDSKEVVCWTCGTEVDVKKIESTLNRLRNFRRSKSAEQTRIEEELSEIKKERSDIQSTRQRRDDINDKLADIKAEIERRESKIEEFESKKNELEDEIEHVKTAIEELEEQDRSEVLEVHQEVNEIELEIDRLKNERTDISKEIEDIESKKKEIETLQDRREQITEQLNELRTRIERIEKEAIEEFNDHMDTVLELLDYGNLERIWVERFETETRQGRQKVNTTEFRLHIVRTSGEGVTYEDDLKHLSESEREVMGLIFALAGYLAHDVHKEVPFILLDSLESIDSERIARVIDYMQKYTDYLVAALLPEDSAALDEDYERVAEI